MPKIVDHDARRREIVRTAWEVIARSGVEGATLREVASEAGFANGALKPYFPTKEDLFKATFEYVFARTNQRVESVVRGLSGWRAISAFAYEVLPLETESIGEARVVMAYWAVAAQSGDTASIFVQFQAIWRGRLSDWVGQAMAQGTVRDGVRLTAVVEALLTFLQGSQVIASMDPVGGSPDSLRAQLAEMIGGWSASGG